MANDEIDYCLLEFMKAHMMGRHQRSKSDSLGVLESAEQIYKVNLSISKKA